MRSTDPALCARSDPGYSLVEMLVVLAIMALMAGTMAASLRRPSSNAPQQIVEAIGAQIGLARLIAVERGQTTQLVIVREGDTFRFEGPRQTIRTNAAIKVRITAAGELIDQDGRISLQFHGDGSSSGLELELSNSEGKSSRLLVNWLDGIARIGSGD